MAEKVKVRVTNEDIRRGRPGNCEKCPIALAICREMGCEVGSGEVIVEEDEVVIRGSRYVMPDEAAKFMCRFDLREEVMPVEFELGGEA